jgi:hypothetical protein
MLDRFTVHPDRSGKRGCTVDLRALIFVAGSFAYIHRASLRVLSETALAYVI